MTEQITIKITEEELKKMFCKYFKLKSITFYHISNFFPDKGHEIRGNR